MKKQIKLPIIKRTSELNWVLGIFLIALGVAICNKANLGVSTIAAPAFIIHEAILYHTGNTAVSVGVIEYSMQAFVLLLTCLIVFKFNWRFLLCFLTAVIYGYVLDMWMLIFDKVVFDEVWLRWIMLFVGNIIISTGVAFFMRTYLPIESYELIVAEVSKKYNHSVPKVKLLYDFASLALSLTLALSLFGDVTTFNWAEIYKVSFHSIGMGTIVSAVVTAPIIKAVTAGLDKFFGNEPLIKPLHKILQIEESGEKKISIAEDENGEIKDDNVSAYVLSTDKNALDTISENDATQEESQDTSAVACDTETPTDEN